MYSTKDEFRVLRVYMKSNWNFRVMTMQYSNIKGISQYFIAKNSIV